MAGPVDVPQARPAGLHSLNMGKMSIPPERLPVQAKDVTGCQFAAF